LVKHSKRQETSLPLIPLGEIKAAMVTMDGVGEEIEVEVVAAEVAGIYILAPIHPTNGGNSQRKTRKR
jgi:hypothetical protein